MAFKKATKKAEKHAKKSQAAATSSALKAEKALAELQKLAATAGPVVSQGAHEARVKAGDLYEQVRPGIEKSLKAQGEKLSEFSSTFGPKAEKFRHDVEQDYFPRAKATAATTGSVLKAAAEAARREIEKGQPDIRKAVLTSQAPKKKCGAGKAFLLLSLVAIGAGAGYVAWKKTRPVEDPWAPPADFARAHYPASAGTESDSSAVSDTVGSAEAGDVAGALKGEDRSSDVEPKVVKVDSAKPSEVKDAKESSTTSTAEEKARAAKNNEGTGKVIDPVGNPEENPQDPTGKGEKKGTHRGDA